MDQIMKILIDTMNAMVHLEYNRPESKNLEVRFKIGEVGYKIIAGVNDKYYQKMPTYELYQTTPGTDGWGFVASVLKYYQMSIIIDIFYAAIKN